MHNQSFIDTSLVKKKSNYTPHSSNKELITITNELEECNPISKQQEDNLNPEERQALKQLKNNNDIVIKKADKGNKIIAVSKEYYRDKLVQQDYLKTETYCQVNANNDNKVFSELKSLMETHKKCLTIKEYQYIINFTSESSNVCTTKDTQM